VTTRAFAIVTGDFVHTGGMDAANFALARHLAEEGHPTHLVAFRVAPELCAHPNVVFHRVHKPANAYSLGAPLLSASGLLQATQIRRAHGVTIVNGGNCPVRGGVNWVHYLHAAYTPTARVGRWRSAKDRLLHATSVVTERVALRAASLVIANSDRTRNDVIEQIGVPADRVRTVYYGTDPTSFRPPTPEARVSARRALGINDHRPRVVFIGALGDRRKGFDVVYDAWRELCRRPSWDADLIVVGTGAELPSWRGRASRDGIAERISFLGFRRDVPAILAACDALVAPTRYEAYGLGVHEALCCGLPALVSASAGVAERYPQTLRDWLLDDPDSADELITKLESWRATSASRRDEILSLSTRLRARSWRDMARDIVAACESEG
jgi:glycosyltransferase involved in cell wall biosynthesis